MIKTRPMVEIKPVVDPNLPNDPRERFQYELEKRLEPFLGMANDNHLKTHVETIINDLILSYYTEGIFPKELFDYNHFAFVSAQIQSDLDIALPVWVIWWKYTGEFLTIEEIKELKKELGIEK